LQIPLANISDEHILGLLAKPETYEQGFRLLMEQYQQRLYWHIRRLVAVHEDANDILQNCLLKAHRGIGRFEGRASLYTWLYRIASNEAITFLKQQKSQAVSAFEERYWAEVLPAEAASPDGDALQKRLHEAIQRLPDKQRLVFSLRYFEEMSYQEMSQALKTSEGALKASYHHAVKKIEAFILAEA
jgi:RNA polymerase sigma-70 factor, ECF subfamily